MLCRWTATPRPALPPLRAPGRPGTASLASKGPITRTFLDVLEALLWGFHNSRSGVCFPSYEAIAAKAECHRSTVAEALKALEWAGVLTWQNRITRAVVRQRDLFGRLVAALDSDPDQQRLRVHGPESGGNRPFPSHVGKSDRNTEPRYFKIPETCAAAANRSPIYRRDGPRRGCQP